jgi:hypothetical protein
VTVTDWLQLPPAPIPYDIMVQSISSCNQSRNLPLPNSGCAVAAVCCAIFPHLQRLAGQGPVRTIFTTWVSFSSSCGRHDSMSKQYGRHAAGEGNCHIEPVCAAAARKLTVKVWCCCV